MINLSNYITEKLHLKKDTQFINGITKDDIIKFLVIYSDRGITQWQMYTKYDNAIYSAKHMFFLDGYCLTKESYEDVCDILRENRNPKDWTNKILDYTKENNIVRLFDYEKLK